MNLIRIKNFDLEQVLKFKIVDVLTSDFPKINIE